MNNKLQIAAALLLAVGSTAAFACDSSTPRCQSLNELVKVLKYEEGVAKAQADCTTNANVMRPEVLSRRRPGMLKGLNDRSPNWESVGQAYQEYVEDACGGPEILGLILEGYRISWDARAPGADLATVLAAARKSGMEGVKDRAALVSADVNRVIGNLLGQMTSAAEKQYSNKLAEIAMGKAMDRLGSCAPTNPPAKPGQEPTLTWPPRKAS